MQLSLQHVPRDWSWRDRDGESLSHAPARPASGSGGRTAGSGGGLGEPPMTQSANEGGELLRFSEITFGWVFLPRKIGQAYFLLV